MSDDLDRYEITVKGLNPTIVWVHAQMDLEKTAGGEIVSEAPMEERGIDPVSAVVALAVVFGTSAAATAGKLAVEEFVQKMREQGGEVEIDHREPDGYL